MENNKYKPVQIPVKEFEVLKEYCELHHKKIGKTLGELINQHLQGTDRLKTLRVIRPDTKHK